MNRHTPAQSGVKLTLNPVLKQPGLLQRKCACGQHTIGGGACAACTKREERLQRHAAHESAAAYTGSAVPSVVHEVLSAPGRPLSVAARTFMEARFGHDFGRVRVHTDAQAVASARAVNALAYTVGTDVVFGAGHYAPETKHGRRLLAHELTHVIQQDSTAQRLQGKLTSTGAEPAAIKDNFMNTEQAVSAEAEAQTAARAIEQGQTFTVRSKGFSLGLARQPDAGAPDADAGTSETYHRSEQVECVKRLGGCANTRPGGLPTPEEIARYNEECRRETGYSGPDVTPTDEECRQGPSEAPPQAMVCARPLHYPALSLVFNHAYIDAPPYRYAIIAPLCTPTDGGSNSLMWGGTAARTWDNSPDPCSDDPQCVPCRPQRGVSDVRQCLRAAYSAYNSPVLHKALGPNSNTFAGTLARACCDGITTSPFSGITPGWDDPPAPARSANCPAGSPTCS